MGWLRKVGNAIWGTRARKYLLIGALVATGVGAPAAVSIGTAVDNGINALEEQHDEA